MTADSRRETRWLERRVGKELGLVAGVAAFANQRGETVLKMRFGLEDWTAGTILV